MNTERSTFVRDQLEEHSNAIGRDMFAAAFGIATRGATLGSHSAAAGHLIDKLIAALEAGLPLCEHLTTRLRLTWAPGMPMLGCKFDLVSYVALHDRDFSCDLCGSWPDLEGGVIPKAALIAAGPVAIFGHLCPTCHQQRAAVPFDVLAVRRRIIDLVEDAFYRQAGGGPDAA